MSHPMLRHAVAAAAAACVVPAFAQTTLPPVTVTGNPLGRSDWIAPASTLTGPDLPWRAQSTLGETLQHLPGVSSTYFGPTASRPVVRGLDGDRVRVLANGGTALDASSLSYDHAVAVDALAIERIEVLRGPAALLYGGNAIGGAVNLIDNRIPRRPLAGVTGKADLGWASGARERDAALLLEGGGPRVGLHVDAFRRAHGDVGVPTQLPCTRGDAAAGADRICNSAATAEGGAVGGSVFFDRGYAGLSASTYRKDYGAVAEDEVTIRMRADRLTFEAEARLGLAIESVKVRAGRSDYAHTEYEGAEVGTVFRNAGNDLRLEARHAKLGPLEGVIGLQAESARFSADGDEAFAPYSRTRQRALFLHEEWTTGWGRLTFGARTEHVQVASQGNPRSDRFAVGERSFRPASASLAAAWNVAPAWQVSASLAHSQRAPKDYELFANGPHVATGAYEVGNPELGVERSRHAEAGVQWKQGAHHARLDVFASRFSNYIALLATGAEHGGDAGEEALPELAYRGVRAAFHGLEASGSSRVWEAGGHQVDLQWRADVVRATNRDSGEALPRIPPVRAGVTALWGRGPWSARLGFDHFARQKRVPAGELPTAGYTLWEAGAGYRMQVRQASLLWTVRLQNATDRLAFSATSLLTQTAPGRVPLPGRSLKVGLQASF